MQLKVRYPPLNYSTFKSNNNESDLAPPPNKKPKLDFDLFSMFEEKQDETRIHDSNTQINNYVNDYTMNKNLKKTH